MARKRSSENLANILFPELIEQDFAESIINIPPELRKLHTETYDFTVETLIGKLKDGSVFVPKFQRRYVWSDSQASRLIESLIIQCPIPVIYLNQEKDEKLSVIDGNQRLSSIRRFVSNEFKLKGLTAYPELEGNFFHELDGRFQRHIMNRALRCIIILKETHPQVKFDVFERLNSGSVKLNPQELRHGIYFGRAIELAAEIAKENNLIRLLESTQDKRMKAEELVLRFLSLHQSYSEYRKPLAVFINQFADKNRHLSDEDCEDLKSLFRTTLSSVENLFGEYAFKIFDEKMNIESKFNSALYDAEMLAVAHLKNPSVNSAARANILKSVASHFRTDEKFRKSISIATSDEQQLKARVDAMKKIIKSAS